MPPKTYLDILRGLLDGTPDARALDIALRILAKDRVRRIQNSQIKNHGTVIARGPFAGMDYNQKSAEGAGLPRLLGAYEHAVAPVIEQIVETAYPLVIDVGCAEGYYAVGLARRMPDTIVWARDANPEAMAACTALAATNGVSDRVRVGGILTHADLGVCSEQKTVLICDIEGAEEDLLDPVAAPALRQVDILVEVHEGMKPGLLSRLSDRFAATHNIQQFDRILDPNAIPDWMASLSDMDRLLALWEWRAGATPWLWMTAK